jgi:hypothetical protein
VFALVQADQADVISSPDLFFLTGGFYVVTSNVHTYLEDGSIAGWNDFVYMFSEFYRGATIWLLIVILGATTPYLLTIASVRGMISRSTVGNSIDVIKCVTITDTHIIVVVLLSFHSAFYLLATWALVWFDESTPITQLMLFLAQSAILWMKGHSYVIINADLPAPTPSLGDFVYFLWAPTLVYEQHFHRTPEIRWSFFVEKACLGMLVFSTLHLVVSAHISPTIALAPVLG